ncbi:hypothetical protein GC173_17140 [bacterium]|nr:hypothetical protein [bacterium]
MPRIVSLKLNPRRRTVVYTLDEGEPLELHEDTAAEFGFRTEDLLDPERLEQVVRRDGEVRCRHAAWKLLSIRPRSRKELETALRQRKHLKGDVQRVVEDLAAKGFLNDAAFARQFVEERIRRKQGPRLIEQELRHKGIAAADAAPLMQDSADPDRDTETMRELLTRWNRRSKPEDPRKRAAAAAAFLARRGFESHLVWEVVRAFFRGVEEAD